MTTTGARLKEYRKYLNLSQEDIAKLIGSSAAYISLVENDRSKLSVENLIKLLLKYNINLNYLLAGIGDPFNIPGFSQIKDEIIKDIDTLLIKYGIKTSIVSTK